MRNDEDHDSMRVSDLVLVTTLVILGFSFTGLDISNPSRVIFEFSPNQKLQEAIDAFWEGKLSVEPKEFSAAQRELKARIRNEIESEGAR